MSIRPLNTFCMCLVLAASVLSGHAVAEKGYYKWMDAKGNPQHSDRPPPAGVEYEFVSTDSGMSRRVSADESRAIGGGDTSKSSNDPDASPSAEEEVAVKKDPALCDQARANLDTLDSKARVRIRDDEGVRYLTEEEKQDQRKRAQDMISVHCGS